VHAASAAAKAAIDPGLIERWTAKVSALLTVYGTGLLLKGLGSAGWQIAAFLR
jgi:hypothetical protein